ncbi:hypothetical protein ACLBP3_30210, partial [Klebsiella pneumoniae]|uniref:hypothetical protein n=1 Tax=Klebsiella pneumoniae TaxID=573 RepID=UPI00396B6453
LYQPIVKECSAKILDNRGSTDIPAIINEMASRADPYIRARAEEKHPAEMGALDFGNLDSIEGFFQEGNTIVSSVA